MPRGYILSLIHILAEYNLSRADVSAVFSLTIAWFGVGCVFGGYLQDTKGPRAAGLWGTALLTFGMAAAGFVDVYKRQA